MNRFIKGFYYNFFSLLGRPQACAYSIISYHRLTDSPGFARSDDRMYVDAADFEQQMSYLSQSGAVIPLEEMADRISGRHHPDRLYVAVTFDDGYADVINIGLPIMERHRIPSTFYISTEFVDAPGRLPWWDEVRWYAENCSEIKLLVSGKVVRRKLGTQAERARFMNESDWHMHNGGWKVLAAGFTKRALKPRRNSFADWEMLKRAVAGGLLQVGAHTVTHCHLSRWSEAEVFECKRRLEEKLGPVTSFSYPYGGMEHIPGRLLNIVRQAGFESAVTGLRGWNSAGSDPLLLKRLKCRGGEPLRYFKTLLRWGDVEGVLLSRYQELLGLRPSGNARFPRKVLEA